jgi:EpsI family protein
MDDQAPDHGKTGVMTRRNLLMGGAMLGVAATAFARLPKPYVPRMDKEGLEKLIPTRIGPWQFVTASGLVLPPPDELADKIYSNVLTRYYTAPDQPPLALLIAYSNVQNGLLQMHRPETCYPASGFRLSETSISQFPVTNSESIAVRSFTAQGVSRNESVLYWTRIGNDIPTSWAEQRWAVAKENLDGRIPDGILVRTSLVSPDSLDKAREILGGFVRNLLTAVGPQARTLLIGDR